MVAKKGEVSTTEALRNFAAVKGFFKRREAVTALGITGKQADSSISQLMKRGHLERISPGQYLFCTIHEDNHMDSLNERLWRAMKAKRTFTAASLALLAESSVDHIYKFVRRYAAQGYIKQQGRVPTHGSGTAKLYRLTLKGQDKARAPKKKAYKPEPAVTDVVELNRLVCSGVTKVDEDAARQCIAMCRRIIKELKSSLEV